MKDFNRNARRALGLGLGTAMAATLAPAAAHASAYYIAEQSTKAAGRAFSGEVADTGPESLWWNPAAIGGMTGVAGNVSVSGVIPRATTTDNGTIIVRPGQAPTGVGGDAITKNPINSGVVPAGAVAFGLGHGAAFGVAVSAPYNFTTDYPATSWARYSALKTSLRTIDIQPTLAIELAPGLRIGGGANIEYVKAELGNALPNLLAVLPDGSQQLKGSGWDVGWSAGFQFGRGPITIGASYRSSIKHTLNGNLVISGLLGPLAGSNGTIPTTASFRTPWSASFGTRIAVDPKLTLNLQATATGWQDFDAIRIGAPVNAALPQNYKSSWTYAGGFDYAMSPATTLRAGIARDETPVRDNYRDARVPDGSRWVFALGGSHAVSSRLTFDLAGEYLAIDSGSITRPTAAYVGTPAQTVILPNGTISGAHAFVLSGGARFKF